MTTMRIRRKAIDYMVESFSQSPRSSTVPSSFLLPHCRVSLGKGRARFGQDIRRGEPLRHCAGERPRCGSIGGSGKGPIDRSLDDLFGGSDRNHAWHVDLGTNREGFWQGKRRESKGTIYCAVAHVSYGKHSWAPSILSFCLPCMICSCRAPLCCIAACFHVHLDRLLQDACRDRQEGGIPRRGKPHRLQVDRVSIGGSQGRGLPPFVLLRGGHRIRLVSEME